MEQGKDRLMSTAEAADRLGVSPRTIARWIKAGELRGVRLGRRLFRVPESEVLRIIAETYEREDTPMEQEVPEGASSFGGGAPGGKEDCAPCSTWNHAPRPARVGYLDTGRESQ